MTGGEIYDNTSTTEGGGVCVYSGTTFEMSAGEIYNNTSVRGGGFYSDSTNTTTISGTAEIYGNRAVKNGTSGGHGAGIYLRRTNNTISGGSIHDNVAEGEGGGLMLNAEGSTLQITGGEISDNTAAKGAGIFVDGGTELTLNGATVSGNTATQWGGGVEVYTNGTFTFNENGEISDNKATSGTGGGIYITGGNVISAGTISGNEAQRGGGVYLSSGSFSSEDGYIKNNTSSNDGGGIYVNNGTCRLNQATINQK